MVDVGSKAVTKRRARATGLISMNSTTLKLIQDRGTKKGDVLAVARIAAIQASKRTSELVPLCHGINLTHVTIDFDFDDRSNAVRITATTETAGQTGVEMEALTAAAIGLLTIYDMCKAVDRGMTIGGVQLLEKEGGVSGHWRAAQLSK